MRDYLYIWNDPKNNFILASGIEFKDLAKAVPHKSLWLLAHEFDQGDISWPSRFMHVSKPVERKLVKDDIYRYGDFSWMDSAYEQKVNISDLEIAKLAYFKQCSQPYGVIECPSIGNQFLVFAHDDGWFLKMYYTSFEKMNSVLTKMKISDTIIKMIENGQKAVYSDRVGIENVERTLDVDLVMSKMHKKRTKKVILP